MADPRTFDYFGSGELYPYNRGLTPTVSFSYFKAGELIKGAIPEAFPSQTLTANAGVMTLAGGTATAVPGQATLTATAGIMTLQGGTAAVAPGASTLTATAAALTLAGGSASLEPGIAALSAGAGSLQLLAGTGTVILVGDASGQNSQATLSVRGRAITGYPEATELQIHAGNDEIIDFQVLKTNGDPQPIDAWIEFWSSLKRSLRDSDADAVFVKTLTGGGIVLDDTALGTGHVVISAEDTQLLRTPQRFFIDVQAKDGLGQIHTLQVRIIRIRGRVTEAVN